MGQRLGSGSRKEYLRKSARTKRGFRRVSKAEAKCCVPGHLGVCPSTAVTQVSPWNSASTGWLFRGPLPLGHPGVGCPASALEDLMLVTSGWQRPLCISAGCPGRELFLSLNKVLYIKRISLSSPPCLKKKRGKAFLEFVFSGLTQKELYVYFLSGSLDCSVHLSCLTASPPPSLLYSANLNFIKLFLTTTTCPRRAQGPGRGELGNEGILQGAQ